MINRTRTAIFAISAAALPSASHAATVTWATWNAVTNNTAITTTAGYSSYIGINFNGSTTTINNGPGGVGGTNVVFTAVAQNGSAVAGGITVANSGFDFQSTGASNSNVVSAVGSPQTWATTLDRVIGDSGVGAVATITLSGLTAGNEYYVQFFSSAPDANILSNSVISSGGASSPAFGAHASGGTKSIIGTFTADGTSQAFTVAGTEPTYGALVIGVKPVPEPSTALLGGLALLGLTRRRR